MNSLPLAGIRVLDLCNVVMGPYTTQILAQYGADVIKVEPPGGDDSRRTGASIEDGMASLFLGVNRGKRSIVLDLKAPQDREKLRELFRISDVFVHNIRPQKLAALGITPEEVHSVNPSIVYTSLTGFGQDGTYGGQPAYDDVIQGMSGLAALFERSGQNEPRYVPTIIADKTVAIMAASAILAAIVKRQNSNVGSVVEVPQLDPRLLVLCGSVNPITLRQMDTAEKAGFTRLRLTPRQKLEPGYWASADGKAALAEIEQMLAANPHCIIETNDAGGNQLTADYADAKVRVPAYFLYGERDTDMEGFSGRDPLGILRANLTDLRGVTELAGAGHLLQLERTDQVNALLVEHLRDLAPGGD